MDKIKVRAYKFMWSGNEDFRGAISGMPIDHFEGHCMVYFLDGQMIFRTGFTQDGERFWEAIGNKPKIAFEFTN